MLSMYTHHKSGTVANLIQFRPNTAAPEGMLIVGIKVPDAVRQKGHGKRMLKKLCAEADIDRLRLYTCPEPDAPIPGLTTEMIRTVLQRNGFKKYEAPSGHPAPVLELWQRWPSS